MQPLRILCTGDLHLGRFPTRVPPSDRALSVEDVWERSVQLAVDEKVDVVCLTGDVVDNENAFFEAYGPLQRGIERLAEAGIKTLAVSGNHDFDVLRRLAGALPPDHFRFVGEGRTWEVVDVEIEGKPRVSFVGWSFARTHETLSPLPSLPLEDLPRDRPLIGMLHCDLDAVESRYLPVSRSELAATPLDTWLLGHIHKPDLHQVGTTHLLYPGSPQPLNPKETGEHGPWLVTVEHGGNVRFEQRPIATLRYEEVSIDVSALEMVSDLDSFVLNGLQEPAQNLASEFPTLSRLVARATLTGVSRLHRQLPGAVRNLNLEEVPIGSLSVSIDRLLVSTRPALDLESIASRRDPAGELADLVLALRRGEDPGGVVEKAVKQIGRVDASRVFLPLAGGLREERGEDPETSRNKEAREVLVNQALLLLHQLINENESD